MNINIKIIIFLLILILFFLFKNNFKLIENLENNKLIILLGDSILNNSIYVPENNSVLDFIKKENINTYIFAKDGAKLNDLDSQIENLNEFNKEEINNKNCNIFISIGGNNILENKNNNFKILNELFENYLNKIKIIKLKYPKLNIYVLNLYKPLNSQYKNYYDTIDYWNCILQNNSENYYKIIDISKIINNPNDLVYSIEPSISGGKKIAYEIVKN